MKSKTSCFSSALFFNTLRRFWPLFAAYPFIWILILPVQLNSTLSSAVQYDYDLLRTAVTHIMSSGYGAGPGMAALFAVLFAMASFSCFYNSRSISAVCSLPIKREGVFLSVYLTGPAVMLLTHILVMVITIIVQGAYGAGAAEYAFQWFGMVTLQSLFFCGFAALCASLTGHILVLPAVYLVLNFTFVVVVTLIQQLMAAFIFGLDRSLGAIGAILSPLCYMWLVGSINFTYEDPLGNAFVSCDYTLWTYIAICAAVGVLLAFAAMHLFRIRRMETAGDVVAFKPLKPIFKYCLCLGCALVLGVWLFYIIAGGLGNGIMSSVRASVLILLACMIVGAFIGYFAAEMLTRKTLRVFAPQHWKGFGAAVFVIVALVLLCELDVFGIERRLPDADDVESVYVYGGFDPIDLTEPEQIEKVISLHSSVIKHKDYHENHSDNSVCNLNLVYYMKDGGSLTRSYMLALGEAGDVEALNDFLNEPEIILIRKRFYLHSENEKVYNCSVNYYDIEEESSNAASLSSEEALELYDCITADMREGTIGLVWLERTNDGSENDLYARTFMDCTIDITFVEAIANSGNNFAQRDFYTVVTVNSRHTLEWLKDHGIEPVTFEESYRVQDRIGDAAYDLPATSSK